MPLLRIALFLVVVNAISFALHAYVGSRLVAILSPHVLGVKAIWISLVLLAVNLIVTMALSRMAHPALWMRLLIWTGFIWMGLVFLLFVAALAGDLGGALLRGVGYALGMNLNPISDWVRSGFLAMAPLACGYGVFQALRPPEIHEIEVLIPGLAREWEGVRIAHVTDTHVGPILGRVWVENLVRGVNSARPDIVVHTGDMVDGTVAALREELEPLARLRGREGTFFVTGNHEAYSGVRPWGNQMRAWGWDVLNNEHRILMRGQAQLLIVGITDAHEGGVREGMAPDLAVALRGAPVGGVRILLAHQPRQALQSQGQGVALQLSGHTHGGQIWPFHYLVRLQQPMVSGFAWIGDVAVFTSRGAGFWGPPLRVGAPAEIPILVLRNGDGDHSRLKS